MNYIPKNITTAIIFTFILFLYSINNVIIVIDFVINQDVIAKTLCVQKEEQKGCNGKCQLTKRLNIDVNSSSKNTPIKNSVNTRVEFVFLQPINVIDFSNFNQFIAKDISDLQSYKILCKSYEVDIPPPVFS